MLILCCSYAFSIMYIGTEHIFICHGKHAWLKVSRQKSDFLGEIWKKTIDSQSIAIIAYRGRIGY